MFFIFWDNKIPSLLYYCTARGSIIFYEWEDLIYFQSCPHTEIYFQNLIKSTRNQIVFTIFPLIWNQTDVRLVPNQSQNVDYNLISVWFNKIRNIFPVVSSNMKYLPVFYCELQLTMATAIKSTNIIQKFF